MDNIKIVFNDVKLSRKKLEEFQMGNNPYIRANNIQENLYGKNVVVACFNVYYDAIITEDIEDKPYMRLVYRESKEGTYLEIQNSIRKWFLGKRSIKEISFNKFEFCMQHLSDIIFKDQDVIFDGNLRRIEIGKTLKISNDFGTRLLFNTFSHKNYKKRLNYPLETLYFMTEDGKNNVKIYDKGLEMKKKKLFRPDFYRLFSKKWMLIRIEHTIQVSTNSFFRAKNIKTVRDFFIQKEEIIDYWIKQITSLEYLELINEKELDFLKTKKRNVYYEFLICKGVERIGLDGLYGLLQKLEENPNRRYKIKNTLISKLESLKGDKHQLTKEIMKRIIKKQAYNGFLESQKLMLPRFRNNKIVI